MKILRPLREQARMMRESGKSIQDIATTLARSKSTISYWCRDIVLTKMQFQRLAKKQRDAGRVGMLLAAQKKHSERLLVTEVQRSQGQHDVGILSKRDIFILGLALYWGEGYKRGNEECGFTNTDPYIIRTFLKWINSAYGVQNEDLILRVSINETHKMRSGIIERYWSRTTGIPLSQFTRISFIHTPHTRTYSNMKTYFGTLRIKVRRATNLRRRIMGSLEELGRQVQETN